MIRWNQWGKGLALGVWLVTLGGCAAPELVGRWSEGCDTTSGTPTERVWAYNWDGSFTLRVYETTYSTTTCRDPRSVDYVYRGKWWSSGAFSLDDGSTGYKLDIEMDLQPDGIQTFYTLVGTFQTDSSTGDMLAVFVEAPGTRPTSLVGGMTFTRLPFP